MANKPNTTIAPADGKLGILIPGMGAPIATFIDGAKVKRDTAARETSNNR